jgi:hypothetical protein
VTVLPASPHDIDSGAAVDMDIYKTRRQNGVAESSRVKSITVAFFGISCSAATKPRK